MRITRYKAATLAAALLAVMASAAEAASTRLALVIGESAYPDGALPTTANDAGLVAQVLQAAGFDVVGARDLDGKGIREAMRDFLDRANSAGPDMQAFVYVSGRALQYAGDNYLVPIDARIARAADAPIEAVKISDFTHALAAAPGLARVVVIDGARANPYAQQGDPLAGGLALVDPEPNTVIAFNAAPGAVGVQDAGDYGVYAKSLSGLMRQGGVDVRQVFEQVRIDVNQQTQGAQIPWSAGKLSAPYFIFERAADAAPPRALPARKPLKSLPVEEAYQAVIARDDLKDYEEFLREHRKSEQARRVEAILAARREALFWRRALNRNKPEAYWTYLKLYPKGPHAYDAAVRLDALSARRAPPQDFDAVEYDDLPPPPRSERVYSDRPYYYFGGDDFGPPPPPPPRDYIVEDEDDDWRDLPPPPRPTVNGLLPALAIAIPLALAARAYRDHPRADGKAPASAPPPGPPRPLGPPPLPRGVTPVAVATPTPAAPTPAPAPRGPGAVRFAAPSAAPLATPAPTPAATPLATPAATPTGARTPLPTPSATSSATPTPTGARTPLPTPSATPSATPTPTGARTPLPTPSASPTAAPMVRTPLPTPSATPNATATPTGARTPLPTPSATPSATPTPTAARTPLPTPSTTPNATPSPTSAHTPLPTPSASPTAAPVVRTPTPTPTARPTPSASPSTTPAPLATPTPQSARTPLPAATPIAPKPTPTSAPAKPADAPKPAPVEAPKPAPPPRVEAPKPPPAPRIEAPKPPPVAPAPVPHVEAPKPPPPPAAPPPPKPEPRAEAPKPAPPPAKAACGHPGEPRC